MTLGFDVENIAQATVEFGVGRRISDDKSPSPVYVSITADDDVQRALSTMAMDTWKEMERIAGDPEVYDPAEEPSGRDHLILPLTDPLAIPFRDLYEARSFNPDNAALDEPGQVFSYYAQFTDSNGDRLLAQRRADQFKGQLKKKLVAFRGDSLRLVTESIFQLNTDFDVLIDADYVHIVNPASFKSLGGIDEAIKQSVAGNARQLSLEFPEVNWARIENHALSHPRSASLLASIRIKGHAENIDIDSFLESCAHEQVAVSCPNGTIEVPVDHIQDFLEVLDRRRYGVNYTGQQERYRATRRHRLQ